MLAPVAEADHGEEPLLRLGLRASAGFAAFCAELREASGRDPGLRPRGTLLVARDADDAAELERRLALHTALGLRAERLRPGQARRAEPALAPTVRLALELPDDHSVDPRRLVAALVEAVEHAGGTVHPGTPVRGLAVEGDRVCGAVLRDGRTMAAGTVLVAAGAHAGRLEGLPAEAAVPVRPLKGQVLRLRDPRGPGLLERTVRTPGAYLVPRDDGRYVLGATMEERGFDTAPTAGGLFELVRDIGEVVPGVLELEIEAMLAGLRPATPDNVPLIGRTRLSNLFLNTGHGTLGWTLACGSGKALADLVSGRRPEVAFRFRH
jgi:glycine oxidase